MHESPSGASHYRLVCSACGHRRTDDGLTLNCHEQHGPALWKTEYDAPAVAPDPAGRGVFRYHSWLPVRRTFDAVGHTSVYRSERLAARLGLDELWVAFNGYWPERGAHLESGSFKELEAATVLGRIPREAGTLVISSAGNTATAFIELCTSHGVPAVVIVPETALARMTTRSRAGAARGVAGGETGGDAVRIIAVEGSDYADAIALGDAVARQPGFVSEGGTRNVGRRDGLGSVLLAAHETIGALPDYYVQAIGSGAGAIAVHEAARRISGLPAVGPSPATAALPRLVLAQNADFAPVHQAWHTGERPWTAASEAEQRAAAHRAFAPELTNRKPPYDVRGGLYDALSESSGQVLTADATAARTAMETFRALEGIDIEPAAGVALAALTAAAREGRIERTARVLLNITGGGRARLAQDHVLEPLRPDLTVSRELVHRVAGDPDGVEAAEIAGAVRGGGRLAMAV